MIEPREYAYNEIPRAEMAPEGMKEIVADKDVPGIAMAGNVVYATVDDNELQLQILYPLYQKYSENCRDDYPCIVFIHGSGWHKQDMYRRIPCLAMLAKRGYVIASVQYRHSDIAAFPAQILDTKTAIRYMRMHAKEYNGDPNRIVVMGDSSGGHTSIMTTVTNGVDLFTPALYPEYSEEVLGCVTLYPPVDIVKMNDAPSSLNHRDVDSPEGFLMGRRAIEDVPAEEMALTNPVTWISADKKLPPVLIMHGDMDMTVPFAQSVILYDALKAAGKDVEFYKLVNAGHGGSEFWTEEVIDIVDNFFKRCVD